MRARAAAALTAATLAAPAGATAAPASAAAAAARHPLAAPAAARGPAAPTRALSWIARLVAPTPAYPHPRAARRVRTLAPLSAWTGGPVGLLVLRARDGWVKVLLPDRPNGAAAWLQTNRVRLVRTRWRVTVGLAARRVTVRRSGRVVRRFPAVVGAPDTPTPRGRFAVYELARQPDPHGFLGPWAIHLTAHSDVLDDYGGGPGRVAIHGRDGASLLDPLGSAASHGCVRVPDRDVRFLAHALQSGVPVTIA